MTTISGVQSGHTGPAINESSCYYRDNLNPLMPTNYYLYSGAYNTAEMYYPAAIPSNYQIETPKIFDSIEDIFAFEGNAVRPQLKRLPVNERELAVFLKRADRRGQITWVNGDADSEIYSIIQSEIDSAPPAQDIHVVFGFAHTIEGQHSFFNELLTVGDDGLKIEGITHIATENVGVGFANEDIQGKIDFYLATGVRIFSPMPVGNFPGTGMPMASEKEMEAQNRIFEITYNGCYNLVMADIARETMFALDYSLGLYFSLAVREIFAVNRVSQRQDPYGRDVVFWEWGASHAEKQRLPFYLRIVQPKAKIVSFVFNGGTYINALTFDRALADMGWIDRPFVLKLSGYREADYIIHLPTEGREQWNFVSSAGNPVVQHLITPLD